MKIPALLLITAAALQAEPFYIGTEADGIYLADFDAGKGTLTEPALAVKYKSPGFLALHPEKPLLYCVGGDNTVAAFTIGEKNSLSLLASAPVGGRGPCHLALDASGRTVTVANYNDGSLASIRLDADGKPGEPVSVFKIEGSGPNKGRQEAPHIHGVYFDNSNRFLFAPDLGTDRTFIYKFEPATSALTANEPAFFTSPPGSGPRHIAFSPDEKNAYIINELTNTVTATTYDEKAGSFTDIQTITTLPADFTEGKTSEIEVHPNGNFVYGSNRGHDTIVVYKRDPKTGKLTFVQHAPCGGKAPRHFKIHSSGKWLICGHQDSDTISVLALDTETGKLGEPTSTVKAPKPICILFP